MSLYRIKVINTCYRFLLDRDDAEDISQEVFVEIFQSIRSFKGNSKLSTWIYRITVSKCLDEIKKRNRKKRITSIGNLLHLDDVVNWISGGHMPDKNLKENESLKEVMAAIDKLPENQRVAFTLSKIDGFSNKDIAEVMDTTLIAVETLISRAKKRIEEELREILGKK